MDEQQLHGYHPASAACDPAGDARHSERPSGPLPDPATSNRFLAAAAGAGADYDGSLQLHRALGEMYETDPRFTACCDKRAPGLAAHIPAARFAET